MSRRRARRRQLAFVIAAVAAAALTACGRRVTDAPLVQADARIVRISQRNEPADLDPATASLPDEFFIIRGLSEGLLVPNPAGGDPLPAAAERFGVSADGLTWTFHLRADGRWSNGEPVTADDFVQSLRRVLTPAMAAPKAHLLYAIRNAESYATGRQADFASVGLHATDAHTLVVELERPSPQFPLYVASGPWIPVHPATVRQYGRHWTSPAHFVGNGPFVLVEWRAHQRIVLRRNPRYRAADRLRVDELQFIRFDNADSEERAFRAGQVDVTMTMPESKLEIYERERAAELHRRPLAETRFLSFNLQRSPLNDARVRQALSLAIDRESIVSHVLHGGQTPTDRYLSPQLLPLEPGARVQPVTHPERARALLREAGFPEGRGFPRLQLSGWGRNPALEVIQHQWRRELGIEVELLVREARVHLAALHSADYDIAFVTTLLDVADPVAALADYLPSAPNNFPHWASAEFSAALQEAGRSSDRAASVAALRRAESLLLASAAVAPLYWNAQNWLMAMRVHGWQQDALWVRRYDDLGVDPR
jgi:oligopeptide transport system substrate-binding protein